MGRKTAFILGLLFLGAGCVGDPSAHLDRARQYAFQRQPADALLQYEEVLSLVAKKDPHRVRDLLVPALKGAGDLCYLELRMYPRAIEYYRQLANHFPDAAETLDARAALADLYRMHGDRRAAVAELTALVQSFPSGADVDRYRYMAVQDYFELADYDQVMIEARALQERFPDSSYAVQAQLMVAESLALQGQRAKSIQAYDVLLTRWPNDPLAPQARVEQAKVLYEDGKTERAVDVLVAALKDHPNPKAVQVEIARLRKKLAARRAPAKFEHAAAWPEFHGLEPQPHEVQ
ncbi:MAG: tetratricopeptide repeat protein [Myxococcales bacterium]